MTPEYEIAYLRARIEAAERVVRAARDRISPSLDDDPTALVYAIEGYADFLGSRPDPALVAS